MIYFKHFFDIFQFIHFLFTCTLIFYQDSSRMCTAHFCSSGGRVSWGGGIPYPLENPPHGYPTPPPRKGHGIRDTLHPLPPKEHGTRDTLTTAPPTDRRLRKHYLPATTVAGRNKPLKVVMRKAGALFLP